MKTRYSWGEWVWGAVEVFLCTSFSPLIIAGWEHHHPWMLAFGLLEMVIIVIMIFRRPQ